MLNLEGRLTPIPEQVLFYTSGKPSGNNHSQLRKYNSDKVQKLTPFLSHHITDDTIAFQNNISCQGQEIQLVKVMVPPIPQRSLCYTNTMPHTLDFSLATASTFVKNMYQPPRDVYHYTNDTYISFLAFHSDDEV